MRNLSLVLFMFIACAPGAAAQAQSEDGVHEPRGPRAYPGPPLSLAAAIDTALERNPSLIVLRQQFEVARHRRDQELALEPPTFEAQIWQWPITTLNPSRTDMYMFTARQEIPGTGKRAVRAAASDTDADIAANEIAVRARDVLSDVMHTYSELSIARRAIDLHLESVALLRQLADLSMARYTSGRGGQHDVLKTIAELSALHQDLVMHEEGAALAAARLNALLDRDPETPIGALDEPRASSTLPSSTELQRRAIDHQPALKAAQLRVERAKASRAIVSRDRKPDFMVGGGYMLMPGEAGAWTASVGVTWPNAPWSRSRLNARAAEAEAELDVSIATVRSTEREIQLRVHEAYVRTIAATERVSLLRTTVVPQTRQTVEASRVAYQADRLDYLTLIDDQRALLTAELSYFRALSERELALADLARAVGVEGLETDGFSFTEGR